MAPWGKVSDHRCPVVAVSRSHRRGTSLAACAVATPRAASPRTSSRSSRSAQADLPRLEPDYNVAPTKEVYAVLERPPRARPATTEPRRERQLRVLTWGLVPFWAKDPSIGSRMINARMETVAEKPAFRRAFERRRALLPADGYFEWYPTEELTKAGKPRKQPFFIRPTDGVVLAMAGLYEIWRDPDQGRGRPRPVPLDLHGAHHVRRGLAGPHPRPDAADADARALRRLARPDAPTTATPCSTCSTPPRPGGSRRIPVTTLVANVRNNGAELLEPLPLDDVPEDAPAPTAGGD